MSKWERLTKEEVPGKTQARDCPPCFQRCLCLTWITWKANQLSPLQLLSQACWTVSSASPRPSPLSSGSPQDLPRGLQRRCHLVPNAQFSRVILLFFLKSNFKLAFFMMKVTMHVVKQSSEYSRVWNKSKPLHHVPPEPFSVNTYLREKQDRGGGKHGLPVSSSHLCPRLAVGSWANHPHSVSPFPNLFKQDHGSTYPTERIKHAPGTYWALVCISYYYPYRKKDTFILYITVRNIMGFPGVTSGEGPTCQCRRQKRLRFDSWVGTIPWRRAWPPTPGESHRQRNFVGYGLESHRESGPTEAT